MFRLSQILSFNQTFPKGSRADWEKHKRSRFDSEGSIRVDISNLVIAVDADTSRTRFQQNYQSTTFADQVQKTLEFAATEGGWKIVREQATP